MWYDTVLRNANMFICRIYQYIQYYRVYTLHNIKATNNLPPPFLFYTPPAFHMSGHKDTAYINNERNDSITFRLHPPNHYNITYTSPFCIGHSNIWCCGVWIYDGQHREQHLKNLVSVHLKFIDINILGIKCMNRC